MNWEHFRTFFWLRWRIRINQLKRGGFANKVLLVLLGGAAVLLAIVLLVASFMAGLIPLRRMSAPGILYVWDGLVLMLLFFWTAGLMADLQRSEVLSLDKFLHLPVSLAGAFIVNYLSSLFSLTLLLFVPTMVGLTLGLAVSHGPAMLLLLPAVAALLLMVTAVTHQFQGWLASLMVNKRRRQTIILLLTMIFFLVAQAPNLFNQFGFWHEPDPKSQQLVHGKAELERALAAHEITRPVYDQRLEALNRDYWDQLAEANRQTLAKIERVARLASLVVPPGWLPLGAMAAVEGKIWPALLATLGMALLGMASLWRSYRTTLRLYTGHFTAGRRRPAVALPVSVETPQAEPHAAARFLEKKIPWLPEQATAIALGSFRSLLRAPEAKMVLMSGLFMVVVFGAVLGRKVSNFSEAERPLLALGVMAFMLMILVQFAGNQFGYDRTGFAVFMLSGARRQDILLGKNMAFAPLALGMALIVAVGLQILLPMRFDCFLALPLQFVAMYLSFCLLANWLSIYAPLRVPAGALRRAKPTLASFALHMLFMFVFFPLAMAPTLLPLGTQVLLEQQGWGTGIPVCLLLSLVECAAVVYVYRLVLSWQGRLLQAREQAIYAIVRTKEE